MKKILLSAAIVSASVCAAYAQDQKTTQQAPPVVKQNDQKAQQAKQAQEWENLLKTELNLTEDQQAKLAAINKDFNSKKEVILNDPTLSDEAKKEKKMALKKDKEAKTMEVLNPEQQVKYKQLVEEKMKQVPKKGV